MTNIANSGNYGINIHGDTPPLLTVKHFIDTIIGTREVIAVFSFNPTYHGTFFMSRKRMFQ